MLSRAKKGGQTEDKKREVRYSKSSGQQEEIFQAATRLLSKLSELSAFFRESRLAILAPTLHGVVLSNWPTHVMGRERSPAARPGANDTVVAGASSQLRRRAPPAAGLSWSEPAAPSSGSFRCRALG